MNVWRGAAGRNHNAGGPIVLVIHPIVQFLAIVVTLYVFYLGVGRFRFLHLEHETVFRWKRHVALGEVALGLLVVGMFVGMAVVYLYWRRLLIMGTHSTVALVMAPLIIFGIVSGLYMDRRRGNRKVLPFVHAVNNLVVVVLALAQVASGLGIYRALALAG
jgi:hypothetical protein